MEEQNKAVVADLTTIIAGKTEISRASDFISQNVISHMDNFTIQGINAWTSWLSFIRTRSRVSELDLVMDRIEVNADQTVTAYARWHARRKGKVVISDEVSAIYRLEDGKITEIWTKRTNYTLIFGPLIRYRLGLLLVMFHVYLWGRLPGRLTTGNNSYEAR